MGGSEGSWGGGAVVLPWSADRGPVLLLPETLGRRAGDAVVAVLCDQRFTLAASWAALERRRVDEDGAWWWSEAVWGCSALAATALASPSRRDKLALRLTAATDDELMEPARDGRRRCEVPGVLLSPGSAAASRGALMLVRGEAAQCLRPRRD